MAGDGLREAGLALLQALTDHQPALDAINNQAHELYGDFAPHLSLVADCVYGDMVKLLDAVLGDGNASYLLHEAPFMKGQAIVREADGREWPLNTVADLRAELFRSPAAPNPFAEAPDGQ